MGYFRLLEERHCLGPRGGYSNTMRQFRQHRRLCLGPDRDAGLFGTAVAYAHLLQLAEL